MSGRALLDVNVLVALFDEDHLFHSRARAWLASIESDGWASCPITQTGFVRVISGSRYPGAVSVAQATAMLAAATADPHHQFWAADLSWPDPLLDVGHILGAQQVTDAYLLALAVHHDGTFVTFDQRVALTAVPTARRRHLLTL